MIVDSSYISVTCPVCCNSDNAEAFIGSKADDYGLSGSAGAYALAVCHACGSGVDLYSDDVMIETVNKEGKTYATNEFGKWVIEDPKLQGDE